MKYAQVILPIYNKNVDKLFTYAIPQDLEKTVSLGCVVTVPFGKSNKKYSAYVVGFCETCVHQAKYIINIVNESEGDSTQSRLSSQMIQLSLWMKEKYYTTMAQCLNVILPKGFINSKPKINVYVSLSLSYSNEQKLTDKQQSIITYLQQNGETQLQSLIKQLKISQSPINTLQKNGIIQMIPKRIFRNTINKAKINKGDKKTLNAMQLKALQGCLELIKTKDKKPILIHGVTGSGKTEVYMEIIAQVLNEGKQAIVLVPEISLTPQTVARFVLRFGDLVNFTHSKLSAGERLDMWQNAQAGDISIIIGPRSAVFAPFHNLGVIIIDEEHEHTYKSETTPKYDAREVAIKRSGIEGATVIFGSATPSLQSYFNYKNGEYSYFSLSERVNNTPPIITVIDMRKELREGNTSVFANDLKTAIQDNLQKGMQTILFLNRRGYNTFVSCRNCGHVMKCNNCNVNYTYHKHLQNLICHYCATEIPNPTNCPTCGSKFIRYFGIGTQRVQDEVNVIFPNCRTVRMDLDTTTKKNSHEYILNQFKEKKADILIGTQMIAKGLDFPFVTLVGIIAADTSLNAGDYRSAEVTFQLLTQVAGRSGRASHKGQVFIQTYAPHHYSIVHAANGNYENFYKQEIALRRQMFYPPFSHLFVILFSGENEKHVITSLFKLTEIMKYYAKKRPIFEVLGPSQALISKIKNKYRWKLIVKCQEEVALKNFVIYTINKLQNRHNIKDIDVSLTINPNVIY